MYGALVWVTFVLALITLLLVLIVGIWFFVERSSFLNDNFRYEFVQTTTSTTSVTDGNTFVLLNPSTSPSIDTVTVTINESNGNRKGQVVYITNQRTTNLTLKLAAGSGVTLANIGSYSTGATLPPGRMVSFVFTDNDTLLCTGTTAGPS